MKIKNLSIIIIILLCFAFVNAQVPNLINYQGMLRDNAGKPITTSVTVTFRIYDSPTTGTKLWEEDHTIVPENGVFNVLLGSVTGFQTNLFTDHSQLYLAIKVGTDEEMTTRFRLGSVAFAMNALNSETTSSFSGSGASITNLNANNITSGTLNNARLDGDLQDLADGSLTGSKVGSGINASNITSGTLSDNRLESNLNRTIFTASDYITAAGGIHVGGTSDPGEDNLIVDGNIGIGIEDPSYRIDVNGSINVTGGSIYNDQVIQAVNTGQAGYLSYGWSVFPFGGSYYHGVYGRNDDSYGALGRQYTSSIVGTDPVYYGVWGSYTGASGYAGYFDGDVNITGTLTKGDGAFKIDHPLDPANKYLLHSFVESPDMKNVYDGVVTLNADGQATVSLPEWFEALNEDFRYQLTCIGGSAQVFISQEVENNRFKISGGYAGLKVSWQVTGIRHDAFAEKNRIQVEQNKTGTEVGKYLHPKAFGIPEAMGINYMKKSTEKSVSN